ncbi:MAG: glycoside hydrolase family 15 protein [Clostridia bacterium]|nr:glycoside hydrolase family 15 protein [Clostridia bacterium]
MTKTYFNHGVIGNSSMLGCLTDKGELVRLFWPHIDYPQHIEKMAVGIFDTNQKNSTLWLDASNWSISQKYIKDTNILETVFVNTDRAFKVTQADFVLPDKDVLVRHFEIEYTGQCEMDLGFVSYSSCITSTPNLRSVLFDFPTDSLIHYMHNYYISVSGNREVYQFQLGNNAYNSASYTELRGFDSIGMMQDGALSWKLGTIHPNEKKFFSLKICASGTLKGVKELMPTVKYSDTHLEYDQTKEYWLQFINNANKVNTGNHDIDDLYKRSLLVFKLMSDKKTGGLLASAEIDETFSKCGRYAYCWGRDAAFITDALDKCGLIEAVDNFYYWAAKYQEEDGSWQQRYYMDGNLAPSWGMQVDETGTLIWGMLNHYEIAKDRSFLEKVWPSVQKGVEFLISFTDEETGLPKPSYDLWEERVGEHTYSCAAVYGGIKSGAKIASILGLDPSIITKWEKAAFNLKAAIEKNLWKENQKRFIRSVRTKLNPWGGEYSNNITVIQVNSKGYSRDVTLEDWMVDVSLLGISIPFGVYDACDYRVQHTAKLIEDVLTCHGVGGIKRYENDNYIGGNPWILTTLWVALYHIRNKNYDKALEYLNWAVKGRTELGMLPEQISKDNGKPAWVIPLTWSHAMFVLVLFELLEAGKL